MTVQVIRAAHQVNANIRAIDARAPYKAVHLLQYLNAGLHPSRDDKKMTVTSEHNAKVLFLDPQYCVQYSLQKKTKL